MMNLLYVGVPVALAIVASCIVMALGRRPRSVESDVADFARGLDALSPERGDERSRSSGRS